MKKVLRSVQSSAMGLTTVQKKKKKTCKILTHTLNYDKRRFINKNIIDSLAVIDVCRHQFVRAYPWISGLWSNVLTNWPLYVAVMLSSAEKFSKSYKKRWQTMAEVAVQKSSGNSPLNIVCVGIVGKNDRGLRVLKQISSVFWWRTGDFVETSLCSTVNFLDNKRESSLSFGSFNVGSLNSHRI